MDATGFKLKDTVRTRVFLCVFRSCRQTVTFSFPASDTILLRLNYKETQRANNSYFQATKERFLFTTCWIIPDCSQCGNHPHCPEIVSLAPASSLKNIYFIAKMLEYELTTTFTLSLLPNVLSLH